MTYLVAVVCVVAVFAGLTLIIAARDVRRLRDDNEVTR